jgi:endonuclease/exonuclease/phosphatase family metal-dependent hydrolase
MTVGTDTSDLALDADTRHRLLRWLMLRLWKWCGRIMLLSYCMWLAALLVMLAAFRWVGEANPLTAFLLFLPQTLWWLPGVLIWPVLLLFRWREALPLGFVGLLVFGMGSGWQFRKSQPMSAAEDRAGKSLVVLTNNRGQNNGQSLRPFKNLVEPDVMLFQESSARAESYLKDPGYAEFRHGMTQGEFTLISRFPITQVESVVYSDAGGEEPYAARFEMDWQGRSVAIYTVHLPSPRETLLSMRGGAFLYGFPVPVDWWRRRREEVGAFWLRHLAIAENLAKRLEAEVLPYWVAGDFNASHLGRIHHLLLQQMGDAHRDAGVGFGFTFPGETRNPLSLGDAWLRLDQVFASRQWRIKACWTESERRSQHRAVAAEGSLELP